jgi:hypothetical protein
MPEGERVARIVTEVFRLEPDRTFSIFCVRGPDDLRRILLGMNSGRDSLFEPVRIVAMHESELSNVRISKHPGETACEAANDLHYDAEVSADGVLVELATVLLKSGRCPHNFPKSVIKEAVLLAEREGCYAAALASAACACGKNPALAGC